MTPLQIEAGAEVSEFILRQAPEPRRALREGLRRLAREQGDIKALQGDLEGYHRLRVGNYRIIFHYVSRPGRAIHCVLIERRALVYQIFTDMVKDRLAERAETPSLPLKQPGPVSYRKKASRKKPAKKSIAKPSPKPRPKPAPQRAK